jgi:lipoate-protein ligase A
MVGLKAQSSVEKKRNRSARNPACFKAVSYGEVTIEGRKIIGSAQKRFKNGFLQQGSILLRFNPRELVSVLGCGNESDFMDIGAIADYAPDVTYSDLCRAFRDAFEKELSLKIISDGPTDFEQSRARELESTRYSDPSWNFQR